jgi:SSS family solute:Na+ symporter
LLPPGFKGVAFAALTAAIVASLAGKANSISTIFSFDIYKKFIRKNASDNEIVNVGRWAVVIAMIIAGAVAPSLRTLDQAYQFIQEYVGFISPGVLAIFLMGFLWKRTTTAAALVGSILTIPVSTLLKFLPGWTNGMFPDYPFLDRMSITFVFIIVVMIVISLAKKKKNMPQKILIDIEMFKVSKGFLIGSIIILGILAAFYTLFW